jgi:glycosyltransferase involved in cell wall biosynthesis
MPKLLLNVNVAWFFLSHRLAIARAARAAGLDVHVAADIASADEVAALGEEELTFHRVHLSRGGLLPARDLGYAAQLASVVRRVRPDLIHNVTAKPIVYGTVVARALNVPGILNAVSGLGYSFSGGQQRRLISRFVASAYRLALRRSDIRVIFQNTDDINSFVNAGIIDPPQAVLIRGSGVELNVFQRSAEPPGPLMVLLPARMLRDKGVIEFAQAACLLRSRGSTARFVLAGMIDEANPAGLRRAELRQLQECTGVEWLGHVSDMPALLRKAHVVCLPSYREGLPKALVEACAAGRPIVATDVPGCRDVVTHGVNGLLVRPRDASALAEALERLLSDSTLRSRMGAKGRHKAETEFDVTAVVAATLNEYRRLLLQQPAGAARGRRTRLSQ